MIKNLYIVNFNAEWVKEKMKIKKKCKKSYHDDFISSLLQLPIALSWTNCFCCHEKSPPIQIYFLHAGASNLFGLWAASHNQLVWQPL